MSEFDFTGKKGYASIRIAATSAIFEVALYGMTRSCQLATDLMFPSGEQIHFKQGVAVTFGHRLIFEHCFLGVFIFRFGDECLVKSSVRDEVISQSVFIFLKVALHKRPIGFMDVAITKHVVKSCESLGCLCEYHNSSDGAIDAMNNSAEYIAGFVVFLLKILFDRFGKRGVAGFIPLHDLSGHFIDNDDMIVFV